METARLLQSGLLLQNDGTRLPHVVIALAMRGFLLRVKETNAPIWLALSVKQIEADSAGATLMSAMIIGLNFGNSKS